MFTAEIFKQSMSERHFGAPPRSVSITIFTHGEKEKKGLLEFEWRQKALNFCGIKKKKNGFGGSGAFVESHMETELQFVAEK